MLSTASVTESILLVDVDQLIDLKLERGLVIIFLTVDVTVRKFPITAIFH